MRGALKAGVGFYEIGLRVTHLHAYADACTDTGGEPKTKARLIQGILMFLSLLIPRLLFDRVACLTFSLLEVKSVHFRILAATFFISGLLPNPKRGCNSVPENEQSCKRGWNWSFSVSGSVCSPSIFASFWSTAHSSGFLDVHVILWATLRLLFKALYDSDLSEVLKGNLGMRCSWRLALVSFVVLLFSSRYMHKQDKRRRKSPLCGVKLYGARMKQSA